MRKKQTVSEREKERGGRKKGDRPSKVGAYGQETTAKREWVVQTDRLGALAELIEQDEWAVGGVSDGSDDLVKVDGECRQVGGDTLGRLHATEQLVDDADLGRIGRHVAADVRQEHDQTHLNHSHRHWRL